MSESSENAMTSEQAFGNIWQIFGGVITMPSVFFRDMPRQGGLLPPLLFLVVAALASGVVQAVLSLFGLGGGLGLASIVLDPIAAAIFGFLSAAVLFVIWKIMGSGESYETAYRCLAYGAAIMPLVQILLVVPYLGLLLALAWQTYLLIVASIEVHKIRRTTAIAVFGVIALLFAAAGLSAQLAARNLQHNLEQMRHQAGLNNTTAGSSVQDMGKLLQKFGQGGGGSAK